MFRVSETRQRTHGVLPDSVVSVMQPASPMLGFARPTSRPQSSALAGDVRYPPPVTATGSCRVRSSHVGTGAESSYPQELHQRTRWRPSNAPSMRCGACALNVFSPLWSWLSANPAGTAGIIVAAVVPLTLAIARHVSWNLTVRRALGADRTVRSIRIEERRRTGMFLEIECGPEDGIASQSLAAKPGVKIAPSRKK